MWLFLYEHGSIRNSCDKGWFASSWSTHSVARGSRAKWQGMLNRIRVDDGVLGWHLRVVSLNE